jgi:chitin synthase
MEWEYEWDKGSNGNGDGDGDGDGDGFTPPPVLTKDGAVEMTTSATKGGYANLPGADASTANFFPADSKGGKGVKVKPMEAIPTTQVRRWWVRFVWLCTWWIPSFLLNHLGGMKRSDIRMAWREKVTICFLILGLCGTVIFYVIFFGKLLCPEFDHAWSADDLLGHDTANDFWVSISGSVYDITNFWKGDHSIPSEPMTPDILLPWAGTDLSNYFPPPLELACAGLVTSNLLEMIYANATTVPIPIYAVHTSGALQSTPVSILPFGFWFGGI